MDMAEKKVRLGVTLRDAGAKEFVQYLNNPTDTPKGEKLMEDAARIVFERRNKRMAR